MKDDMESRNKLIGELTDGLRRKVTNMNKIRVVTIKVTDFCNFNCSYCFENDRVKNKPSVFTKEEELLEFLKNFEFEDRVKIQLFGGELFTEPAAVESIISTIQRLERYKDTKLDFGFITNGSLVKNMIPLIKDNHFTMENCKISYDGLCSHYTRGFKYNKCDPLFSIHMNDNLKELAPYCKDALISMAVTTDNIPTLFNTYRYVSELGYKNFEYYLLFGPSMKQYDWEFTQSLHNELLKIMEVYDHNNTRLHNYELYKGTFDYQDCNALGHQVYISTNGDVWWCGLVAEMFNDDIGPDGNISDLINNKPRIEQIKRMYDEAPNAVNFKVKEFCQDMIDCQYRDLCNTCPLVKILFKRTFKESNYCPFKMIREAEKFAFDMKEQMK